MPDLRHSATPPRPAAVELDRLRALSRRDASRSYGCTLLDVRANPAAFLPGSAWLPVSDESAVQDELPSHMLPRSGTPLVVVSDRPTQAAECARQLRERGWPADYLDVPLPDDLLSDEVDAGAAWQPDRYLMESMPLLQSLLTSPDVVDIGCGNGRNLVYLARLGLRPLGVDHLPEALALAHRRASHHRARIETLQADLLHENTRPPRRFAAAICVRFTRLEFLRNVESWLAPEGILLFHGYGLHPTKAHPRTMRRAIRLSQERLVAEFPASRWTFLRNAEIREDDGECWISFVAQRLAA